MNNLENLPDVLTSEEVRIFLNIGREKTYQLLKYEKIKSIKIGKVYRIPKQFLKEFLFAENGLIT